MGYSYDTTYRISVSNNTGMSDVFDSLCDIDTYTNNIRHECYHDCNFIELCMEHSGVERECFLKKVEKVSKKHTDIIIAIQGHGDKFGDLFVAHFLNGEMDFTKIELMTTPKFGK
jgi:hypothetical protein